MKQLGMFFVAAGIVWLAYAYQLDTAAPYSSVVNLDLMEHRRDHLMFGGLTVLAGILLWGFGSLRPQAGPVLSAAQKSEMEALGITENGGKYCVGGFSYDTFPQAVTHARVLERQKSSPEA